LVFGRCGVVDMDDELTDFPELADAPENYTLYGRKWSEFPVTYA
jgi:hypothetical protein